MYKLYTFFKTLFAPMTVAGVMADFSLKVKQLEAVAKQQRDLQAKHAVSLQNVLAAQAKAEDEEMAALNAAESIKALTKKPQTQTLSDLKKEIK